MVYAIITMLILQQDWVLFHAILSNRPFNITFETVVFFTHQRLFVFDVRNHTYILISLYIASLFSFQDPIWPFGLVGSSGLEPPTSRLSGVRSNHLSYEPM